MSRSLWNLVKCLSERLHWHECTHCKSYLDYMSAKDDPLIFRSLNYKKQIAIKALLMNWLYKNYVMEIVLNILYY